MDDLKHKEKFDERFSRLALILKDEGLRRLEKSTVMVLGLGGVGSSCAEALARGGVGTLILLDRDTVEITNINRQALAFTSTLGKAKADVMEAMVKEINPSCRVYSRKIFLTPDNIPSVLSSFPRPDYIIDCIDTVSQKLALAEWAIREEMPLLSSMGAANKLDPTKLSFSYIEDTSNCPLSRVMRKECRNRGIRKLEVLYSSEIPMKQGSDGRDKASNLGTMSYMPPIMGQMLAGKVLCRLSGLETYKNKSRIR